MSTQNFENILIGVAVVALVLGRQLAARKVNTDGGTRLMLILGVVGVIQAGQYINRVGHVSDIGITVVVISLSIGALLAYARANTVRIWRQEDGWWRKGSWLTLVLWLVSIGSHFGIDALATALSPGDGRDIAGLGSATLVLYLGVSLGLQQLVLERRVAAAAAVSGMPAQNQPR